tara:strand:- start:226 stop:483 length:258 start_codon:yes stop_codon:yes gene_type:complete
MIDINPEKYNLSARTKLKENSSKKIFIIVNRKSRIIMKDGLRLLEVTKKIKLVDKNKHVGVLSSAPVCSKTKIFLEKNGVFIKDL